MAEDAGADDERVNGMDDRSDPGRIGVLVRLVVALIAVALGVVWIVRLAIVGSTLRGGLLFELLGPLVLLYFGIDYLQTQRRALDRRSRSDG